MHWTSRAAKDIAGKKVEEKGENIIGIHDIMYDIQKIDKEWKFTM